METNASSLLSTFEYSGQECWIRSFLRLDQEPFLMNLRTFTPLPIVTAFISFPEFPKTSMTCAVVRIATHPLHTPDVYYDCSSNSAKLRTNKKCLSSTLSPATLYRLRGFLSHVPSEMSCIYMLSIYTIERPNNGSYHSIICDVSSSENLPLQK